MNWLGSIIHAIVKALIERYDSILGKTVAKDADRDDAKMRRAGSSIRKWMQSRNSGKRG